MQKALAILNHRDFVLSLALVLGLLLGEHTRFLADHSVISLALVMVFATSGFSFKSWHPPGNMIRPVLWSVFLNYLVFGTIMMGMAALFFPVRDMNPYFIGFVLLAAAPPGPSVIPFAQMLGGDNHFSVTGVFGLHLLAVVLAPLVLIVFLGQSVVGPWPVIEMMGKVIVLPLVVSRFLRHPRILPIVEKTRETVIKWGFFLVVMPIMGMSAGIFFSQWKSVLAISLVLLVSMYGAGLLYHAIILRMGKPIGFVVSSTLMMVTKSSAFSAVVAFSFFQGQPEVTLPSAVVSVFVTLFIIVYAAFARWFGKLKR